MSDLDSIKAYQILRDKLPALRFDDGDVVVKLGVEPNSHLLVHSEMIKLAMPTLAPMFKAEWSMPETVVHPVTGKEVKVYSLEMKSDVDLHEELGVLFHRLELAADGTETIMQILSYAEYYGCFDRIVPLFCEIPLEKGESLWSDVAKRPQFWVKFAMKLRSTKLYCDALRHLIVQNRSDERTPEWATCNYKERPFHTDRLVPWSILGMSQGEYTAKFQPSLNKLDAVLGGLERNLHQLQLQPYHYRFSREGTTARTTFLNFLTRQAKRHPHRTDNAHLWERSEFLARSLWGQWLVQQLHGHHVYTGSPFGKDRSKRAGPFNVICRKIVEASESKDPSRLVGYKPAERIASIFQLGRDWHKREAERRVKQILEEIVHEAAAVVEKAFEVKEWSVWDGDVEQKYATRRCKYDEYDGYFTYLTIKETDVPWKGKEGRMQSLPEVDMAKAYGEWLEAVALSK
ncbi:hypothetical protein KC315_g91 [Hortaea werneckii]|nr:hypothetical protein KC315_g91 [Hortaea werneckii]